MASAGREQIADAAERPPLAPREDQRHQRGRGDAAVEDQAPLPERQQAGAVAPPGAVAVDAGVEEAARVHQAVGQARPTSPETTSQNARSSTRPWSSPRRRPSRWASQMPTARPAAISRP